MSLPTLITQAMEQSVDHLAMNLNFNVVDVSTHRTAIITGWNDNDMMRQAVAKYLVGLIACAIDAALNIRAELEDTPEERSEILDNVYKIVGNDESALSRDQKQKERNPWIAEGVWHLCLTIANRRPELHPMGAVIALDYAHVSAKDHGLDVAAIYDTGQDFGLTLIESKAYKNDPNSAITQAVGFFKDVDAGRHSMRIRQTVQIMRNALPPEMQDRITGSFWHRIRSYVPNPHYDSAQIMDWSNPRPSFNSLQPSHENIVVMPHAISDFDGFFERIADEMRTFARSL